MRIGPIGCDFCGDVFQLVELFGATRDAWIEEDLQGWLAPNRIYPGVPDVLRALLNSQETYIVTTKQVSPTPRTPRPPRPPRPGVSLPSVQHRAQTRGSFRGPESGALIRCREGETAT